MLHFFPQIMLQELERGSKKKKKADFLFFPGTGVLTCLGSGIAQNFARVDVVFKN